MSQNPKPTVGRIVMHYPNGPAGFALAAIVTGVEEGTQRLDLTVFAPQRNPEPLTKIPPLGTVPGGEGWAWPARDVAKPTLSVDINSSGNPPVSDGTVAQSELSLTAGLLPPKPGTSTDFSIALANLRAGYRIRRSGWGLEGPKFIYLVAGSNFEVNRPPLLQIYPLGTPITYRPHIDVVYHDGDCGVWAFTQDDLFALDWYIVPLENRTEPAPQISQAELEKRTACVREDTPGPAQRVFPEGAASRGGVNGH